MKYIGSKLGWLYCINTVTLYSKCGFVLLFQCGEANKAGDDQLLTVPRRRAPAVPHRSGGSGNKEDTWAKAIPGGPVGTAGKAVA